MIELKVRHLKKFNEKMIGLTGSPTPYPIYFQTRLGIHTFGVKHPIDVLILDKNHRVVKMVQYLKPNRLFFWNPIYEDVVELPAGEVEKNGIKLNSKIQIVPSFWRERSDR